MWISEERRKSIVDYLRANNAMTAREIVEGLNLGMSPLSLSKMLINLSDIMVVDDRRPYKYKAMPEGSVKRFSGEWEKKKNIISFYFTEGEDSLDYDFNINDFTNYDKERRYLRADDFVRCFLEHRPVSKIEWLYNYKDILGDGWYMRRADEDDLKNYKVCPKGFIEWIKENEYTIFGGNGRYDNPLDKYLLYGKIKKYLNDRQFNNLKDYSSGTIELVYNLLSHIGTSLTKMIANSAKEYDFIGFDDLDELYKLCQQLQDFTVDENRGLTYNIENKKRILDLRENAILAEKLQRLNFLNNQTFGKYIVKVPQSILDLQNEGQQQNNCVGHYYNDSIKLGNNFIYFLRLVDNPEHSCVTCRYNIFSDCTVEHRIKNNNRTTQEQEDIINLIDKIIQEKLNKAEG